ncbi:MAG: hypothetical protein ACLTXL_07830 [Clostridia bacterium]
MEVHAPLNAEMDGCQAVPYLTVASWPALQWVRIPSPSCNSDKPYSPNAGRRPSSLNRVLHRG